MDLTVQQQLELFTAMEFPDWLPTDDLDCIRVMFEQRGRWKFTSEQLRLYIEGRPNLVDRYFQHCAALIGIHDKVVLVREGAEYKIYDQDHGKMIEVEKWTPSVGQSTAILK